MGTRLIPQWVKKLLAQRAFYTFILQSTECHKCFLASMIYPCEYDQTLEALIISHSTELHSTVSSIHSWFKCFPNPFLNYRASSVLRFHHKYNRLLSKCHATCMHITYTRVQESDYMRDWCSNEVVCRLRLSVFCRRCFLRSCGQSCRHLSAFHVRSYYLTIKAIIVTVMSPNSDYTQRKRIAACCTSHFYAF